MKVSEVLEIALRKYYGFTGDKCESMCHAVSDFYSDCMDEFSLSDVKAEIKKSINEEYTLDGYLYIKSKVYKQHSESEDDMSVKMNAMKRAHWKRLIKKLKEEGR